PTWQRSLDGATERPPALPVRAEERAPSDAHRTTYPAKGSRPLRGVLGFLSMPHPPPDDSPLAAPLWQSGLSADPMLGVFRKHFAALRAAHGAQSHEGVLVAAIDRNGLFDAHVHLRLPQSGIAHLIIGRHDRCDFVLSRDSDVSLRHVLVRATRGPGGLIQLRAIDLRSLAGLTSEDGRRCEALAS